MAMFNYTYSTILIDCVLYILLITYLAKYFKWQQIFAMVFVCFVFAVVIDPFLAPYMEQVMFLGTAHTFSQSIILNGIWFVVAISYLVLYTLLKQRRCEINDYESQTISVSV